MIRWGALPVAALCAAALCPPAAADPAAATEVVRLAAVIDGRPAPGYRVAEGGPGPTLDGCARSPFALDPGIYACGTPGAAGARACWPSTDQTLLCLLDAEDRVLHRYRVAAPPAERAPWQPAPLGLELAGGAHCYPVWGGAWGAGASGYASKYSCSATETDPAVLVLAHTGQPPVDRSGPTWTVLVGDLSTTAPASRVVTRALFAAAS